MNYQETREEKKMIESLLSWQNWFDLEELQDMNTSKLRELYKYYGDMPMGVN